LRRDRYDIAVDFQGLLKSALTAGAARAGRRIGPSFHREGSRLFYDEVFGRLDKNRHAVEENMDVVGHLGLKRGEAEFPVTAPPIGRTEPRPRVAMFVSSRWPTKNWSAAGFALVARRLVGEEGATVYLGGAGADIRAAGEVERLTGPPGTVNLAGKLSLAEMVGLLSEVDLVVSNDTGPIHAAAALGKPVLALFGPTDPGRTGPYGTKHRVIVSAVECRPCFSRSCRRGDIACMAGIAPDKVFEAARGMLSGLL
jgi:ADP-heptose:LPS heptosyltransferase